MKRDFKGGSDLQESLANALNQINALEIEVQRLRDEHDK